MVRWIMERKPVDRGPVVMLGRAKLEAPAVRGAAYDFLLGPIAGEKHGVFALGSLHLIQGSSGNGKTTLALPMLKAQRERADVFGRQGTGREYLVVWQDRSQQELERQLDAMGIARRSSAVRGSGRREATGSDDRGDLSVAGCQARGHAGRRSGHVVGRCKGHEARLH
jgi:hypothetical protein